MCRTSHPLGRLPGSFQSVPPGPLQDAVLRVASEGGSARPGTSRKVCALVSRRFSHRVSQQPMLSVSDGRLLVWRPRFVCVPLLFHRWGQSHLAILNKPAVNILSFLLGKYRGIQLL